MANPDLVARILKHHPFPRALGRQFRDKAPAKQAQVAQELHLWCHFRLRQLLHCLLDYGRRQTDGASAQLESVKEVAGLSTFV